MTKYEGIFQNDNVWKSIAAMAIPAMVSMLVMIFYNIADMFFIAFLKDSAMVAAVSIVGPVFSLIMAFGSMIGAGGCNVVAKALGDQNRGLVKLYSSVCCWGSIVLGIILAVLILAGQNLVLKFLGANEDMWDYARDYLFVLSFGAPAMIFSTAFANILRGVGAVKEGMVANLMATVTNVLLDPVLILLLELGVTGAAVATVLGNVVGCVYLLRYILKSDSGLSPSLSGSLKYPKAFATVIAVGLPNAVSTSLSSFARVFANQLLVGYGTLAVAAMAAAGKSTMIIGMIQMGLCMGVQPLLAYHYGAKDGAKLKETIAKLALLTFVVGGSITVLCMFKSGWVVSLFLKEPEALELGQRMVRLLVISGPFLGFFYIGSNFLQASGNAAMATLVSALRQGILLIPMLFAMNHFFGVTGNIWAHIVADMAAAVIAVVLALHQYRKFVTGKSIHGGIDDALHEQQK